MAIEAGLSTYSFIAFEANPDILGLARGDIPQKPVSGTARTQDERDSPAPTIAPRFILSAGSSRFYDRGHEADAKVASCRCILKISVTDPQLSNPWFVPPPWSLCRSSCDVNPLGRGQFAARLRRSRVLSQHALSDPLNLYEALRSGALTWEEVMGWHDRVPRRRHAHHGRHCGLAADDRPRPRQSFRINRFVAGSREYPSSPMKREKLV